MIGLLLTLVVVSADPVATAAKGLVAQIEDDNGPDAAMTAIRSAGCTLTIAGKGKRWTVELARVDALSLEDTFVYIAAPPHKLAIVGDASKPHQERKLKALATALGEIAARCRPR